MTKIADLLGEVTYSFEFFPPKNDAELATLPAPSASSSRSTVLRLGHLPGRGGVAPAHLRPVSGMLHTTSLNPMAHLICVAHSRLELAEILVALRKAGVENLMALGGDPPRGPDARAPVSSPRRRAGGAGPRHRRLLHRGGRPPGRPPRSTDLPSDRDFLAAKLELADFGVTQFFFEV